MRDSAKTKQRLIDELEHARERVTQLERDHARVTAAVDGSEHWLWDWPDLDVDRQWWSSGFFDILGYEDGAFQPTLARYAELLHPDDRANLADSVQRCLEAETTFESEYRIRRKSGEYVWLRARGRVYRDESGKPVRMAGSVLDVTNRRQIADQLRKNEARFRALYNQTPALMQSIDAEGRLVSVSDYWLKRMGYKRDEALGRRSTDFLTEESRRRAIDVELPKFHRNGIATNVPYQFVTKDGEIFDGLLSAIAEFDSAGMFARSLAVITDVTERIRTEEALRKSETRLKIAGSLAYDLIYEWDVRTDRLTWFSDIDALLGYPVGYASRSIEQWLPLMHPEDRAQLSETIARHRTSTQPISYEYRILHANGEYRYWIDRGLPVLDEEGRPRTWIGVCTDITQHKRVEEDLRRNEELLTEMGRIARVGGWEHDLRKGTARWTQGTYDIIEIAPGEPIPGPGEHLDYYPHEDRVILEHAYQHAVETGEPFDIEVRCNTAKKRKICARAVGHPVFEDGKCVMMRGMFQDLTEIKRAEEERRELEEQLRQAQKMEAVGTLAAGAAHDFNNALMAIYGYADAAAALLPPKHDAHNELRGVLEACNQATAVTKSLLTFSRDTSSQLAPTSLGQVVRDATRMLQRLLPAAVEFAVDVRNSEALWIEGDTVQLQQVLLNLVVNAHDAMPEGGSLRIEVTHSPVEATDAWTTIATRGLGTVLLVVEDSGVGMSEEVRARVCEPFFTTKDRGAGTGLGMSVVHGIVAEHGGQMYVDSQEGHGTRVAIEFPRIPPQHRETVGQSPRALANGAGATVLLAEDNDTVRRVIASALKSAGYDVIQAADGAEALERAAGAIQLAILDVDMPKLSGTTCMERMRAAHAGIPVILMTGFQTACLTEAKLESVTVLQKPFPLPDLIRLVGDLLKGVEIDEC